MSRREVSVVKILNPSDRADAVAVVEQVFQQEKQWIRRADDEIPRDLESNVRSSWFLCRVGDEPAGVIRLFYDPPLEAPPELDFKFERDIDFDRVLEGRRFADIGRFMILPKYRRRIEVALQLMKVAVAETVERGYTHFITDVFESDPHCPLDFHTRVLGFERIGTHRYGELDCSSVRIILVLDLARAYHRLARRRDRVFRQVVAGMQESFEALPVAPAL
ncbi:MAG: GNAT family N-acetyltransferase [Acidobacteriota bacterium]